MVPRMGMVCLRKGRILALARVLLLLGCTCMYNLSNILLATGSCAPVVQTCPPNVILPLNLRLDSSMCPDDLYGASAQVSIARIAVDPRRQLAHSYPFFSYAFFDLKFELLVVDPFYGPGLRDLSSQSRLSSDSTMRSPCRSQMSPYPEVHCP